MRDDAVPAPRPPLAPAPTTPTTPAVLVQPAVLVLPADEVRLSIQDRVRLRALEAAAR